MTKPKKIRAKILTWVFVVAVCSGQLFPYLRFNGSWLGFDKGGQENTPVKKSLIITGAGYFLQSPPDFLLFLKEIELSDL